MRRPKIGQTKTASVTMEEQAAEFFQLPHAGGERRLRDGVLLGRLVKFSVFAAARK